MFLWCRVSVTSEVHTNANRIFLRIFHLSERATMSYLIRSWRLRLELIRSCRDSIPTLLVRFAACFWICFTRTKDVEGTNLPFLGIFPKIDARSNGEYLPPCQQARLSKQVESLQKVTTYVLSTPSSMSRHSNPRWHHDNMSMDDYSHFSVVDQSAKFQKSSSGVRNNQRQSSSARTQKMARSRMENDGVMRRRQQQQQQQQQLYQQ